MELSAQNLKRLFSIKPAYEAMQAEWIACNYTDSTYYKADTIKLYSDQYYYMATSCCDFITWNFEKSTAFSLIYTNVCREPPVSSVYPNNDFHIKFATEGKHLILSVYNNKTLKDQFAVIALDLSNRKRSNICTG
jgi:hypothetical protein